MKNTRNSYGIIILAAGNSSRLGQPKQLLEFRGKSLLFHTVDEAVKTTGNQVVVVTGVNTSVICAELNKIPVQVVHNKYSAEGIASSIYLGTITLIGLFPDIDGLIISVCDQPFISTALFKKMIQKHQQKEKGIIAAYYNGTAGVPVLFSYKYVELLLNLQGDVGARDILKHHQQDMAIIPFTRGYIDIDTIEDKHNLSRFDI